VNERDHTPPDEPRTAGGGPGEHRGEEPAVAPNPEVLGGVPVTITPTGAPVPMATPVDADPKETRWLALAVALGIAVMLLIAALLFWL
jgi:hypothetical protein